MKKLFLFTLLAGVFFVCFAGNFRSTTTSNTAQTINTTSTALSHFNALNTNTVTIYIKLYEGSSVPTYTSTPSMTLQCEAGKQIWWNDLANRQTPFVNNFNNGCYVRTVLGVADTYTVSPTSGTVIFEASFW